MNTTTDTNRVYTLSAVHLITEATGTYLLVFGLANTSASNARLVSAEEPQLPEEPIFDLIADHGDLPVMTPVCVRLKLEIAGIGKITVRTDHKTITIVVPQQKASAVAARPLLHQRWSVRHFVVGKALIPVLAGTQLTALFSDQGTIDGFGGCNAYGATFRILMSDPPGITIDALISTMVSCREEIMEQEQRFFGGLRSVTGFECTGHTLTLHRNIEFAIVFEPAERQAS